MLTPSSSRLPGAFGPDLCTHGLSKDSVAVLGERVSRGKFSPQKTQGRASSNTIHTLAQGFASHLFGF